MITTNLPFFQVHTVLTAEIFGVVRSLMAFRLTGGGKDFLIVGSDSGRITILEYNASKNALERVHMETFGKSGCRRIVPGQYLAIDPKGRAKIPELYESLIPNNKLGHNNCLSLFTISVFSQHS